MKNLLVLFVAFFVFVACNKDSEIAKPENALRVGNKIPVLSGSTNSMLSAQDLGQLRRFSHMKNKKRMMDLDSLNLTESEKREFLRNYLHEKQADLRKVQAILDENSLRMAENRRKYFKDSVLSAHGFDELLKESVESRSYVREVILPKLKGRKD